MKKVFLLVGIFTLACCGVAMATLVDVNSTVSFENNTAFDGYVDHGWGRVDKLDCLGDYVSWSHEFDLGEGFVGVSDATLTLVLGDDRDPKWFPQEFALYVGEDKTLDLWEVDSGSYTFNVLSEYLMDGEFSGTLASLGGDFFVKSASLNFSATMSAPAPVPEPATMWMVGTGLIGLASVGRKAKKKK